MRRVLAVAGVALATTTQIHTGHDSHPIPATCVGRGRGCRGQGEALPSTSWYSWFRKAMLRPYLPDRRQRARGVRIRIRIRIFVGAKALPYESQLT